MSASIYFGPEEIWINSHEIPSGDLTVEVEEVDVTPLMKVEPDMSWTYVDHRGHFHAFAHDGTLPTIKTEEIEHIPESWGDGLENWGGDSWIETIQKCVICDEVIEPRYREHMPVWRETRAGRKTWTLDVRWPGDVLLPKRSEYVSVRIKAADREYFGIGLVANRLNGASQDLATVEIVGAGDLGSRKVDA